MNRTKTIKSPLRYPGGKSRAIKILDKYMPEKVNYYYEPFVGGGSVMLHAMQKYFLKVCHINDIRKDLIHLYRQLTKPTKHTLGAIREFLEDMLGFQEETINLLKQPDKFFYKFEKAAMYFIGNRCSYIGDYKLSGFSPAAFSSRFTQSSIDRLIEFGEFIANKDIMVSNRIFQEFFEAIPVREDGTTFVFIDPPYYHNGKSKLYKNHSDFNHTDLKQCIDKIAPHCKFMLTYGDCPEIREMYKGYNITEASWSYGIGKDKTGKELIIRNYE